MTKMDGEPEPLPKVVEFDPRAERRQDVIEKLERMLEQARAGDLISFAYAGTHRDGCFSTGFTGTDDQAKRIGALQMLVHRLLKNATE